MKIKLISTLIMGASLAVAQTNNTTLELETMIVSAKRSEEPVYKVAGNVDVISAEDIEANKYLSVVDAVKDLPGVYVKSTTGNNADAELSMRGFGENSGGRVLVLLDGERVNNPDMATLNWLLIPMMDVDKIEVVHGGASSMYGDNAVAGAINIITKVPEEEVSLKVKADAGSYGMYNLGAAVSGDLGKVLYDAFANVYGEDGYRDNSDFDTYSAGADFSYDLSDALNIFAGLKYSDVDKGLPGSLTKEQIDEDRRQSTTPEDRTTYQFMFTDVGAEFEVAPEQKLSVEFGYQYKETETDIVSYFSWADIDEDRYCILPKYILNFDLFGGNNELIIGSDIYFNEMTVDRYSDAAKSWKSINADLNKNTFALYAHDSFEFAEDYILYVAGRVENYEVKADVNDYNTPSRFNESKNDTESAFDIGLTKVFDNKSKIFIKACTMYRIPFLDEQISYYGYGTDTFYQDIDPETGWDIDLGTSLNIGDFADLSLTLFYMEMEDEIAYNADTWRNENMDETRHMGVEASMTYMLTDAVELFGNYTFNDATFINGANKDNDIPLVPKHNVLVGAWIFLPAGFAFKAEANYISSSYLGGDYSNSGDKLDEYVVVNALLNYSCQLQNLKGLSLYMAVDNIFDEEYSSVGYQGWSADGYYPEPGTTFSCGLAYEF